MTDGDSTPARPTALQVRTARAEAGLTQHQAAALLGVSRASWARWEADNGAHVMPAVVWIAFQAVLTARAHVSRSGRKPKTPRRRS